MNAQPKAKVLQARDLLRLDFFRQLFRALWLFFPAVIFLAGSWFCFWKITQGKDLMIIALENRDVFGYYLIALFFWAYTTWYSSRAVAKLRELAHPDPNPTWTRLRVQFPRFLAFTCFTLQVLAFFQLPYTTPRISPTVSNLLLAASIPYYLLLYRIAERWTQRNAPNKIKFLNSIRITTWLVLVSWFIVVLIFQTFMALIIMLVGLQAGLVLLLAVRRKILEEKGASYFQKTVQERGYSNHSPIMVRIRGLLLDEEDRPYFRIFIGAGFVALIFYVLTIFSVSFSVKIGSFPFVILAFGVLLIMGNIVAFFSVLFRFNLHGVLLGLAVIIGFFNEPHFTELINHDAAAPAFRNRQQLPEYFYNWVNNTERSAVLDSENVDTYPVYFVLANGGASRSGYWVASVLSRLEDTTTGAFSRHLFCLSGASGGSVGNAAFFTTLHNKQEAGNESHLETVRNYLGSDFLTYTLARMLGPDVFRHIIPLARSADRAAALATALERAPGQDGSVSNSFATGFSGFITQRGQRDYSLPILCINTTRMQDGRPAVISNINFDGDYHFNNRVDVLNLVDTAKDLKLSSAVVLGASFPYVSPAGRIDQKVDDSTTYQHYFVDGGYFDNSGAGIVNEMIIELRELINAETNPLLRRRMAKLRFYVLHITNDPVGYGVGLHKVNPLVNDLLAPLKTLMGAYSSQTSVNDLRLKNYMRALYPQGGHYRDINLYRWRDLSVNYSMNWVISDHLLDAMDERLYEPEITKQAGYIIQETRTQ